MPEVKLQSLSDVVKRPVGFTRQGAASGYDLTKHHIHSARRVFIPTSRGLVAILIDPNTRSAVPEFR